VIREEIERLLENITTWRKPPRWPVRRADRRTGQPWRTDVHPAVCRNSARARYRAQWFDVRKIMRTNDRFGRAEPDIAASPN
jgi:aspartate kinase